MYNNTVSKGENFMAQMNYEAYLEKQKELDTPRVQFFKSLKKDGDEAIIRLAHNSRGDFEVVSLHKVKTNNNRFVNVSCLRDLYEKKETCGCPLCKSENKDYAKVKSKVFVKFIEYTTDKDGKVVATPQVWERPTRFIEEIVGAFNDGVSNGLFPATTKLSDVVFKVRRSGAEGDTETKYYLTAGNPTIYPEAVYAKDALSAFDNYDLTRACYTVKTAEELDKFLATGDFEAKEKPVPAKTATVGGSIKTNETLGRSDVRVVNTETVKAVDTDIPYEPTKPVVERPVVNPNDLQPSNAEVEEQPTRVVLSPNTRFPL